MHSIQHIKSHPSLLLLPILLAAVIPPLFLNLGVLPMQLWDEARIAVSAQEMMRNGNLLVVHYAGRPDMWSVKPPLMVWLQAFSMSAFGMYEWATRLPGAIACVATSVALYLFFAWKKAPVAGLIAALVLVTSQGFVTLHCSRTGDYDSLLACFTTAYCLCYFVYLHSGRHKFLYAMFAFLALAAFSKGVAALFFLPALFLFTLYKKQLLVLLKNRHFYVGLAGFIIFIGGYYLLRERYNPGYIHAVWENELGGRYSHAKENNTGHFLYYFNNIRLYQFKVWVWILIPGIVAGMCMEGKKYRDLTLYLLLLSVVFFLVISSAQTKLYWYSMPLYPFISCIAALFIYYLFTLAQGKKVWLSVASYGFLLLVFIFPYGDILGITTAIPRLGKAGWDNEHMAEIMQKYLRNPPGDNVSIVYTGYQANIDWYLDALKDQLKPVGHSTPETCKAPGNILVFQDSVKKYMETHYQTTILQTYYNVTVYRLNGKREQ